MLENELYKPSLYGAGGLGAAVVRLTGAAYWQIVEAARRRRTENGYPHQFDATNNRHPDEAFLRHV